jgi:outer membrane biosynthesis protein TonB
MKAKRSLALLAILVTIIAITVACTKARSDAQIASDVQNKVYSDAAVQSRQITVQSSNGIVTLSGYVATDAERAAAANDAATVEGVKTVVNNLEATAPATANAQPQNQEAQQQAAAPEPAPAPEPARHETRERASAPEHRRPSAHRNTSVPPQPAPEQMAAANPAPAVQTPPPAPAPPPAPVKVTIPDGTTFSIRLIDAVDSETAQPGQTFRASLDSPIVIDDQVVIPSGADISGRVVDAKSAGRFAGRSSLAVELFKLSYNGKTYSLHTNQYSRQGSSRGATTAKRTGAGAAIGAIIGGLAGGGKGAAIGATVGGGAGAGATAVHKGEQIKFDTEQVLVFTLQSPLTVTPAATMEKNRNRQTLEE